MGSLMDVMVNRMHNISQAMSMFSKSMYNSLGCNDKDSLHKYSIICEGILLKNYELQLT